jgi:hypothetical protein
MADSLAGDTPDWTVAPDQLVGQVARSISQSVIQRLHARAVAGRGLAETVVG